MEIFLGIPQKPGAVQYCLNSSGSILLSLDARIIELHLRRSRKTKLLLP
jgi:hypothetical protein